MNLNKNISVWRGNNTPPSQYHLWLKGNKLYHNNGIEWIENKVDLASLEGDGLMSKEDKEKLYNLVYDGLDSNDGNKALSAKQGKILKELLDAKVIEAGDVPIDTEPIEGNITHIVNSDGLAKKFNHVVLTDNWDEQDDDPEEYDPLAVTEASYAYNWKTTDAPASDGKSEGNLKDLYNTSLKHTKKLSELCGEEKNGRYTFSVGQKDSSFQPIEINKGDKFHVVISGVQASNIDYFSFYNETRDKAIHNRNKVEFDVEFVEWDCAYFRIELVNAPSEELTVSFIYKKDGKIDKIVQNVNKVNADFIEAKNDISNISDILYGKSLVLDVIMHAGSSDTLFVPMGHTIKAGTKADIVVSGGDISWIGFYNADNSQRSDGQDGNIGTQTFPVDCVNVRIELASPVSVDTEFKVEVKTDDANGLVNDVVSISEKIDLLNEDYKLYYGNLDASGNPETDVRKNRAHSSLFDIDVVKKISCSSDYDMGFILRDKNGNFLYRHWVDGDTSFDTLVASTKAIGAKYIQLLIEYYPDTSIVFDLENNPPVINVETRTKLDRKVSSPIKMGVNSILPTIIFNFDDCFPEGDEKVAELFEELGVRCGFAFIASEDNIAKKSALYLDLQKRGFNILNHSSDVNSIVEGNYTFNTAKENITSALARLQKIGFIINGFVCPNSEITESFKPIVNKTHAYNFVGSNGGVYGSNDKNTDVGDLLRWGLQGHTRAEIKSYIDECIANGKCLVLYGHTSQFDNDATDADWSLDKVRDILNYCIQKRNNLECYLYGCDDAIKYYFNL